MLQPLQIVLGIKGAEKLAALKSSFRDLTKTVKQSDADIEAARKSINDYVKSANNSEAVIRGQIKAFEGLREQAAMGGKVYLELSNDIADLKAQLNGSTSAIDAHRKSLLETAGSAKVTQSQLLSVANALSALQKQTALGSKAFVELGADIANLEGKIAKVKTEQEELNKLNLAANQAATGGAAATRLQIKAINEKVAAIRDEKRAAEELSRQSKIRLGMQKLLDRPGDVPFRSREYIEQAVAGSLLGENITKMFGAKELQTAIDVVRQSVAELQNQIEIELGSSARRAFQEMARQGRESARSLAIAFSGPEFERIFANLEKNVGELPNTTAGLSQRLRELERVLNNTARGGDNYVAVALEIARVQREASAATQGLGAALVNDLASNAAVRNQKNLREAIGQLQAEMSELNTETAEGSAKYAENARQVNRLQKELDGIANSYRTVADMAQQAAAAQGAYANTATARNYFNRAAVRAQEVAGAQFAEAVRAGVASTPLMLPAAGQTTAPGTGALMSGLARPGIAQEARRGTSTGERPDQPSRAFLGDVEAIAARKAIGPVQPGPSGQAYIAQAEAIRKNAEAKEAAARVEANYRAEIDKATKASNGSINSSNRLRSALEAYRSTLPTTSKEFANLTKQINDLDRRSEAVSRRMSRRRMSPMQMTQAAGAAISGGIFGGPEGFLGGAIGAIGGVGSAFAGAAIGAQIGQLRKAAGGVAEYVAKLNLAKATLAGVSADQVEYNQNLEFARKISGNYAIRLKDVITGYASVAAAAKANNLSVKETQTIYEGITASGIAFGKSQEDLQALFLATTQVLSKGKASAEEISGQIGERIPGAVAKFAEATKRSLPELAKAFKDGEVTIADFVKFAQKQGDDYAEFAQSLADGPEKAGLRLQIALDNASEKFGGFFLDIGAGFQDYLTNLVNFVVENEKQFKLLIAKTVVFAEDFVNIFVEIGKGIWRVFGPLFKLIGDTIVGLTQGLADLVKQGQIERAAREKGIGAGQSFELRKKAEAEIAREEGGRNVFDIGQSERINQRYFEKLAQLAGITTGPTTRANRIAAILKKFDEFTPERFGGVQTGGGAAPSGETESPSGKGKDPMVAARRQFASEFAGMERSFAEVARLKLAKTTADLELQIIKAQKDQNKELEFSLKQKLQLAKVDITIEGLTAQIASRESKIAQGKLKNIDTLKYEHSLTRDKNSLLIAQTERNKILAEQDKDRFLFNQKTTEEIQKQTKAIEDARFALREQFGLVSPEEKVARAQREFKQKYPGATAEDLDLIRQQIDPTTFESLQQNISRLKKELKELVDPVNQITGAANAIGTSFADSFKSVISGSATAQEALAGFFKNIANYFLDMAAQIIQKWITMVILNTALKLFPTGNLTTSSGVSMSAGTVAQAGYNMGSSLASMFANGGIMTEKGPLKLNRYASGGIARSPQLAMFGEGSMPEAYVPLPDGRSIPVTMRGSAGVQVDAINITIENTGDQLTPAAQKQLAGQVQGIVLSTLANERRSGGML